MAVSDERITRSMPAGLFPKRLIGGAVLVEHHGLFHKADLAAEFFTQSHREIHIFAAAHGLIPAADLQGSRPANADVHAMGKRMIGMSRGVFAIKYIAHAG